MRNFFTILCRIIGIAIIIIFPIWLGYEFASQKVQLILLERQTTHLQNRVREMDNSLLEADGKLRGAIEVLKNTSVSEIDVVTSNTAINQSIKTLNKSISNLNLQIQYIYDFIDEPILSELLNGSVGVYDIGGMGSGTVLKKTDTEMYILTCYHVVRNTDILSSIFKVDAVVTVGYVREDTITNHVQGLVSYAAKIIKTDPENDLALLKVFFNDPELITMPIAKTEPQKGDKVFSIGNPLEILRTVSKGILSNKKEGFYYSDNTSTFGNSGGGLFNQKGELIGVPAMVPAYEGGLDKKGESITIPESGLGLSIDLSHIREFLKGTGVGEE